jgi:hypothetical protein
MGLTNLGVVQYELREYGHSALISTRRAGMPSRFALER